jgi:mannose/fructose/N-acetylgalactosamine-specific phosphotransferase system component IIC
MTLDILTISLLGALLSLDRTAAFQSMIAQPIITAPIIGFILGDVYIGIKVGTALQLLWICNLPLGSYIPPDENLAAILITSCAILGTNVIHVNNINSFVVLNILLLLPLAYFGSVVDMWVRNVNSRLSHVADKEVEESNFNQVERKNILGMTVFYIINFAVIFVLLSLSVNLPVLIYKMLPDFFVHRLAVLYPVILIVGVVTLLYGNKAKKSLAISTVSFLFFSIILEIFKI